MTKQEIYDRFSFLEGLVSEDTYRRIVETAVQIQSTAVMPAAPSGAVRGLGRRLAELLDEDHWAECEPLLLGIETAPRALVAKWRHAAEHLGLEGLASLSDCADELEAALSQTVQSQAEPAAGTSTATREFTNERGNAIRITIEGPISISENILTPMEAEQLRSTLNEHAAIGAREKSEKAIETLRMLLSHEFAEDCQECAIGKSNDWMKAKEFISDNKS